MEQMENGLHDKAKARGKPKVENDISQQSSKQNISINIVPSFT